MKHRKILIQVIAVLFIIPFSVFCQEWQDLVQQTQSGTINWTNGVVQAKGIGAPPDGSPAARPMAIRAAKMDAYRNLLETIKFVRINSTTTVENYIVKSDIITSQVEGMIRGADIIDTKYLSDGTIEVTVQMGMRESFSSLVLPKDIQQVETVKPISKPDMPPKTSGAVFTGLIVDAKGLKAKPAMSPKVVDENGQEVYGSAYVSREFAVQQGMSGYAKDLEAAAKNQRVTDNPLLVKGIKTSGPGNSDIVISNADAAAIRGAADNLSFLKKCRVMIVVD